jgi:hypothetical protein
MSTAHPGGAGLRRGSEAARFLGLQVRISSEACMPVFWKCCMLSGRGLCDGPIIRPEASFRVRVSVCVSLSVINNNPLRLQCVGKQRSD